MPPPAGLEQLGTGTPSTRASSLATSWRRCCSRRQGRRDGRTRSFVRRLTARPTTTGSEVDRPRPREGGLGRRLGLEGPWLGRLCTRGPVVTENESPQVAEQDADWGVPAL